MRPYVYLFLTILASMLATAGFGKNPTVYFTKDITPEALVKIYEALSVAPKEGQRVAVKISTGESAQAVHNYFKQEGEDIIYINVKNNLSIDCDCDGHPSTPQMKDIGILASTDPVVLDKA